MSNLPKRITLSNGLVLSFVEKSVAQQVADEFRESGIQEVSVAMLPGGMYRVSGRTELSLKKARYRKGPRTDLLDRHCIVCSKSFQPAQLNTKMCSAECKAARHKFHQQNTDAKRKVHK